MSETAVPAPVQAMIDAINAADTDAFVDAFSADGGESEGIFVIDGDRLASFTIPPSH